MGRGTPVEVTCNGAIILASVGEKIPRGLVFDPNPIAFHGDPTS